MVQVLTSLPVVLTAALWTSTDVPRAVVVLLL